MENIHLVDNVIQEGDWMIKMDLKVAYFPFQFTKEHRHWLRFQWQEQVYEFQCLPFGLSSAPRVFTKVIHSKEEALLQTQLMLTIFQTLGFLVNTEKSLLNPCQEIEFLGVMIQSHPPALYFPLHKLQTIKYKASQLLRKDSSKQNITVREIAQFIGTANAVAVAIPPPPLFTDSSKPQKIIFKIMRG